MKKFSFVFMCCGLSIFLLDLAYASEPNPLKKNEITKMNERPERLPPKPVSPVEIDKVRYEIIHRAKARGFGQDGGVITAVDIATGKELWTLVVYKTVYDPDEEIDVQDVYITKLIPSADKMSLRVENEAQRSYVVNLSTHEVLEVTER